MRVKVVKTFADKCTYKMYAVGEIVDLPDERAFSVIDRGLAESAEVKKVEMAVKEPKATKTATKKSIKRVTKKKED